VLTFEFMKLVKYDLSCAFLFREGRWKGKRETCMEISSSITSKQWNLKLEDYSCVPQSSDAV